MVVGFAMRRLCDGARDRGVRLTERAYMSDSVLLTCPKCHHVLDRKVTGSVEVDVCGACGGLWLDRAELYYASSLSLPVFPAMSDEDVERVISTLTRWAAS